jgi:hypothetical protein
VRDTTAYEIHVWAHLLSENMLLWGYKMKGKKNITFGKF